MVSKVARIQNINKSPKVVKEGSEEIVTHVPTRNIIFKTSISKKEP
jgi:hypothetical protein